MEEEIIQPISKDLLRSELTPEKMLRMTNKSHNEIYVVTAKDAPNVMKEIGRLREIAFRTAGGGTGKSMDIAANLLCGILKLRRSLEDTDIFLEVTGKWERTGNLWWLLVTCFISQRSLCGTMRPILWS